MVHLFSKLNLNKNINIANKITKPDTLHLTDAYTRERKDPQQLPRRKHIHIIYSFLLKYLHGTNSLWNSQIIGRRRIGNVNHVWRLVRGESIMWVEHLEERAWQILGAVVRFEIRVHYRVVNLKPNNMWLTYHLSLSIRILIVFLLNMYETQSCRNIHYVPLRANSIYLWAYSMSWSHGNQ